MTGLPFTDFESYLFHNGTYCEAYKKMGAHVCREKGADGVRFRVWAPGAKSVSALVSSSGWNADAGKMHKGRGGVWTVFVPGAKPGDRYRFMILGADGITRFKSDPYAFSTELRPENASIICAPDCFEWSDADYLSCRSEERSHREPMAVYEVHLGSWKRDRVGPDNPEGFLNYRRLADELSEYVSWMGYTHVELIGICEHPFDGSWGYQVTGFYSPTSRYGSPEDFKYFVDTLHAHGIGVILDWVPAHFPKDDFGLERFDGTPLYESGDPLRASYPQWGTNAFDHGRPEVRSFLISSAFYWIREFHIDALRVDAVAAILYNSFGRSEWRPNKFGGTENLEGMEFLKQLNTLVTQQTRGFLIAEDSSILPGITKPAAQGGYGFAYKWNMGWMNDTLKFMGRDPIYRHWHHDELTHVSEYAFLESFVLALSHDEVVHLKHSMLEKMPGGLEDKLGALKTLYTFQFTFPGKKLLFMGQDFGDDREWSENRQIDWHLAEDEGHRDVLYCVQKLLSIYREYGCLHSDTGDSRTFEWINRYDYDRNVISYVRRNPWNYDKALLVICSFSPKAHPDYSVGVPAGGLFSRIFSSYDFLPGEERSDELPPLTSLEEKCDEHPFRLEYGLRPYEAVILEFPLSDKEN